MTILFSAFTGFNYRELLLPLTPLLDQDDDIDKILVISPGAPYRQKLFAQFNDKYEFVDEQPELAGYAALLKQLGPDIVVTPTAGLEPKDVPLIKAAQKLNIPTLTFVSSWDNVYKMERLITMPKYQQAYALADHFAVWNAIKRDHLLDIVPHLKSGDITVTGTPRLDLLNSPDLPGKSEVLSKLNIPDKNQPLIHIATTELYPSDYIVKALASARGHQIDQDFVMFVSVHPGGQLATHQPYSKPYGAYVNYSFGRRQSSPVPEFIYNPSLADIKLHAALFKHTDLLINHSSTVTIESVIADTPVINIKYGRPLDWIKWYRSMVYRDYQQHFKTITDSGATTVVNNPRQLIAATRRYLDNPQLHQAERRQLAKTLITYTDGSAGRRLLDLIKNIAQSSTSP